MFKDLTLAGLRVTFSDVFWPRNGVSVQQWSNHGNVWPTKWSNYAQDLSRHSRILWGCYWLLAALKTLGVVQNYWLSSVSSYQSKSWQTDFPGPFTWESFQDLGLLYQQMVVHAEEDEVPPAVSWLCKEMRIRSTSRHAWDHLCGLVGFCKKQSLEIVFHSAHAGFLEDRQG